MLADVGQRDVRDRQVQVRDAGDEDQRDQDEAGAVGSVLVCRGHRLSGRWVAMTPPGLGMPDTSLAVPPAPRLIPFG